MPADGGREPSVSYMTKEQLNSYLTDLRTNRPARPSGSRPPPPSTYQAKRAAAAALASATPDNATSTPTKPTASPASPDVYSSRRDSTHRRARTASNVSPVPDISGLSMNDGSSGFPVQHSRSKSADDEETKQKKQIDEELHEHFRAHNMPPPVAPLKIKKLNYPVAEDRPVSPPKRETGSYQPHPSRYVYSERNQSSKVSYTMNSLPEGAPMEIGGVDKDLGTREERGRPPLPTIKVKKQEKPAEPPIVIVVETLSEGPSVVVESPAPAPPRNVPNLPVSSTAPTRNVPSIAVSSSTPPPRNIPTIAVSSTPPPQPRNAPSIAVSSASSAPQIPHISVGDDDDHVGNRNPDVPQISFSVDDFDSKPAAKTPAINVAPPSINVSSGGSSSNATQSRRPLPTEPPAGTPRANPFRRKQGLQSSPSVASSAGRPGALCTACGSAISGRIAYAAGSRFHPDCFRCFHCSEKLEHVGFFPEPAKHIAERAAAEGCPEDDLDKRFYCHLDFHEMFSPRCKNCTTPIEGEIVVALGSTWHPGHFFCAECGDPFNAQTRFVEKDGYAWCLPCHGKRYSSKCKKCKKPVTETVVNALGAEWHIECFCCAIGRKAKEKLMMRPSSSASSPPVPTSDSVSPDSSPVPQRSASSASTRIIKKVASLRNFSPLGPWKRRESLDSGYGDSPEGSPEASSSSATPKKQRISPVPRSMSNPFLRRIRSSMGSPLNEEGAPAASPSRERRVVSFGGAEVKKHRTVSGAERLKQVEPRGDVKNWGNEEVDVRMSTPRRVATPLPLMTELVTALLEAGPPSSMKAPTLVPRSATTTPSRRFRPGSRHSRPPVSGRNTPLLF